MGVQDLNPSFAIHCLISFTLSGTRTEDKVQKVSESNFNFKP